MNGWNLVFAIVSLILAVLVAVLTYLLRRSGQSSQASSSTEAETTHPSGFDEEIERIRDKRDELIETVGRLTAQLEEEQGKTQANLRTVSTNAALEIDRRVSAEVQRLRVEFAEQKRTDRQKSNMISRSALLAKVAEHMGPLIPGFPYNFKECRHIGEIVDYIVYEGLEEGGDISVIFLEIKTSATGRTRRVTNPREKALRSAIDAGRVRYEVWQPPNAAALEKLTRDAIQALEVPALTEGETNDESIPVRIAERKAPLTTRPGSETPGKVHRDPKRRDASTRG